MPMLLLALACTPDPEPPVDSEPVDDSEAPGTGTGVGDIAPELSAEDADGNEYTLGQERTIVLITPMWVPNWQDVVRDVDAFYLERGADIRAWDVLVEDLSGELPDQDDAAIWRESLGLSMPVLTASEKVHADWFDPAVGPFVVVVDEGVITWRATVDGYSREALVNAWDAR